MPRILAFSLGAALLYFATPLFCDDSVAVQAYSAGVDKLQKDDWKGAEAAFRKAVAAKPDYAEAYDKLGLALCGESRQMEAITELKLAVAIDPRLTVAWYDLGQAFENMAKDKQLATDDRTRLRLRKPDVDNAMAAYRKALEVSPSNDVNAQADSEFRLGVLLRDEAIRAWITLHPPVGVSLPGPAPAEERANLKEAMQHLEAANVLNPEFPENRNELGRLYDVIGRYREAIGQYNKAIAEKPRFAEAYSNRGVAWWKSGNWDRALADTLKATRIDFSFAGGHYNFAEVLFAHVQELRISDIGENRSVIHLEAAKAIAEYTLATKLDPAFMPAWYGLARAYRGYFDFADAEKTYDKIMVMDPRQHLAKLELKDMLKQEAGYVDQIPRAYRPTPTPIPGQGN